MNVRAKFRCNSIKIHDGGREITLNPVYGKDGTDNATWSKYTPSGSLTMNVTNPAAYEQFEVGKEYFLDFSAAPSFVGS